MVEYEHSRAKGTLIIVCESEILLMTKAGTTSVENKPETGKKQKRNPEKTRAAILKAAEKLFINKGFDATRVKEIAVLAGVNQSLIHHYFKTKHELFLEVMRRHLVKLGSKLQKYMSGVEEGPDFLKDSVKAYFDFLRSYPDFIRMGSWFTLFFQQNPVSVRDQSIGDPADDAAQGYIYDLVDSNEKKIKQLQEEGFLRKDIDGPLMQLITYCLVEHWLESKNRLLRRLRPEQRESVCDEAFLDAAIKILLEGASPRK